MIPLQEYVDRVRKRVTAIQAKGGPESEWVLDGAAGLTPGDAATLATALEKNFLMWFDEPTAVLTTEGSPRSRDESVMPIGAAGRSRHRPRFRTSCAASSLNVLRPGLGLNSLTKIKRIAALAETHYVAVAPYHAGGPIGALAGIHLAAALPNSYTRKCRCPPPTAMQPCAPNSPPATKKRPTTASPR